MGIIEHLSAPFYGDLPPDQVLRAAVGAGLDSVVVIGYKGEDLYFATSSGDGPKILWTLEEARRTLMES